MTRLARPFCRPGKNLALVFFAAVAFLPHPCIGATDPLARWNFRHPLPGGNNLLALIYTNDLFVAAGDNGTILTSRDGTNWSRQITGVTTSLKEFAYGKGRYVAVGDSSTIISSTDATNWISSSLPPGYSFTALTIGGGLFVAGANASGSIWTSPDGIVWSPQGPLPIAAPSGLAYGKGRFVAASPGGFGVSTNGTNWMDTCCPIGNVIAFGQDLFVTAITPSATATSTNGLTWASHPTGFNSNWTLQKAHFDGSKFWLVSVDVLTSADGINWQQALTGFSARAVATGNGLSVIVGAYGLILTSRDGSNWVNQSSLTLESVTSLSYANARFVGTLGAGHFLVSSNGRSWKLSSTTDTNPILKLIWNGDTYLAAAERGVILKGTDITNLTPVSATPPDNLNGIAYGTGTAVAVGDNGKLVVSSNLVDWTQPASGTTRKLFAIAYGGGNFVCVGAAGTILSSANGVAFANRVAPTTTDLVDVTFGLGRFLAVGNGVLLLSTNSIDWQRITLSSSVFSGIGFGAGRFALCSRTGSMRSSTDGGLTWIRDETGNSTPLKNVVFGNGAFVTGGDGGIILQSGPVVQMQIEKLATLVLTMTGPRERDYRIEWTDRLPTATWNLLITNRPATESFSVIDPDGGNSNLRFYQATFSDD